MREYVPVEDDRLPNKPTKLRSGKNRNFLADWRFIREKESKPGSVLCTAFSMEIFHPCDTI